MLQPNLEGYEIHEVALKKKEGQSLGISIIGYNALTTKGKKHIFLVFPESRRLISMLLIIISSRLCCMSDAVGVFVKNVVPGSAAEQSGKILVHDRIIAVGS